MPAPAQDERILVVAPHPDDEVLGCGGLIQQALARGAEVDVILMTNGDASELALLFEERELPLRPSAYVDLGKTRQQETLKALGSLGLQPERIHFLGYPNNGLVPLWQFEHWPRSSPYRSKTTKVTSSPYPLTVTPNARYCGSAVLSNLVTLLKAIRPTDIYVSHPRDTHPDHWATSAFVSYALSSVAVDPRQQWARNVNLYGYLVHWPHFPAPRKANPRLPLNPPADLTQQGERWIELPLSEPEATRKMKAVKMYRTQMPRLARLLPNLVRRNELVESLPVTRGAPDRPVVWEEESNGRRRLGGSEVLRVRARFASRGTIEADLLRASPKLKSGASVFFDVRGFDRTGAPAGVRVQLQPHGSSEGLLLQGNRLRKETIAIKQLSPGWTEMTGIRCPFDLRDGMFVVTCWGHVRTDTTSSAVVARVALAPAAAQ